MDKRSARMFVLVFLAVCSASGSPHMPDNLKASTRDGEVTVVWDPAVDVASVVRYSVQMARRGFDWMNVSSCTMIQTTLCDLTTLIHNYMTSYSIRVHTITANGISKWALIKKFLPNSNELRPPSFALSATSSSLTVKIDEKPVLRKIFLFGMTYTIYLEETGKDNETTTAYLHDDMEGAEGRTQTFRSLHWGREYCVRLRVEGTTALHASNVSAQQCRRLPEREWYVIAVTLSILGVLAVPAVMMSVICCFVRRPEKMPVALKYPKTYWSPLTVGEGHMEVVTDKGWFLSTPKAHTESLMNKEPETPHAVVPGTEWKSERRTSMDSGVSVCTSTEGSRGAGSFGSATEEPQPQGRRTRASAEGKTEDSAACGPGGERYRSSSSGGQDGKFPPERTHLAMDRNRHQGSPAVRPGTCDGDEALKEIRVDPDRPLVDVVAGYRKGQPASMCQTDRGPWPGAEVEAGGGRNAELSEEEFPFSTNYRRKTHIQMETVVSVDDSESSPDRLHAAFEEASAPMFLPLAFLPLAMGDLGCAMNTVSISLSDVELWSE